MKIKSPILRCTFTYSVGSIGAVQESTSCYNVTQNENQYEANKALFGLNI